MKILLDDTVQGFEANTLIEGSFRYEFKNKDDFVLE